MFFFYCHVALYQVSLKALLVWDGKVHAAEPDNSSRASSESFEKTFDLQQTMIQKSYGYTKARSEIQEERGGNDWKWGQSFGDISHAIWNECTCSQQFRSSLAMDLEP